MATLTGLVRDNQFTPDEMERFLAKLFFEGRDRRRHLERFGVLLFLSAVIATFGVIGESAATVIGAMIIAPLMTPIIATAAGLVVAQPRRALRSTLVVLAGVAGVIGVGFVLSLLYTGWIDFANNGQIMGRIEPRMIDLYGALACGAAGAFAMSRDDIADSLPGVAISISLVPPLTVVGIGLGAGEWEIALGALLLFLTNYLAILLAGGGVLVLLGLSRAATRTMEVHTRRAAFVAIAIGMVLVAVPLSLTSARLVDESLMRRQVLAITQAWLAPTEFKLRELEINFLDREVHLLITGPGEPPPIPKLATDLREGLETQVEVEVEVHTAREEASHMERPKRGGLWESLGSILGIEN
jgi:uncharacterized hydrophobic protein (TIGR00271 family)